MINATGASSASAKAYLLTETGDRIDFQFNPAELAVVKRTSWKAEDAPGKNAPQQRFQAGQPATMNLSMLIDATDSGRPVTATTELMMKLVTVDPGLATHDEKRQSGRPPLVSFHWGPVNSFQAVVESLTIKYVFFTHDGTPLRARCDVTLKQYDDDEVLQKRQNPTSGTPYPHAVHHLAPGETLDRVAHRHYRDSTQWRLIADANGIDDPSRLRPGTALVVPQPPVVGRG
ncbi:MAG: LysM peptidoglycan-binding domain-containing protein [Kineosporiaceae bacterium]